MHARGRASGRRDKRVSAKHTHTHTHTSKVLFWERNIYFSI